MNLPALIITGIMTASSIGGVTVTDNKQQSKFLDQTGVFPKEITLYKDSRLYYADGVEHISEGIPFTEGQTTYIPVDDILSLFEIGLGWDDNLHAISLSNESSISYISVGSNLYWINGEQYEAPASTISENGIVYMPVETLSYFSGCRINILDSIIPFLAGKRELPDPSIITDKYRLPGDKVNIDGYMAIVDNIGMEIISMSDDESVDYADAVNSCAKVLPNSVNVYDILVPTSAEFYAPTKLAPNQTASIKRAYEQLDGRVIPINAVKNLWLHADEKIYLNTDHHWTHLGAYYAYEALMANKGEIISPLQNFEQNNLNNYVGSMRSVFDKFDLTAQPEILERFLPSVNITGGCTYNDMYMQEYVADVKPITPEYDQYYTFISGDNPLTVFTTDVNNGKKALLIKDSYGDSFATWILNNYSEVYIVDPRYFNGFWGHENIFKLKDFYELVQFDDLIFTNYVESMSKDLVKGIRNFL